MILDKKYFFLNRECIFEKGAINGAIYNLYTGDIFAVEGIFSEILYQCECERLPVVEALKHINQIEEVDIKEIEELFYELVKLDLGEFYAGRVFVEKVKPLSSKRERIIKDEPPSLEKVWLRNTNTCNLRCIHCNEPDGAIGKCGCTVIDGHHGHMNRMNMVDWERVIREASLFNCREVQFVGGEPLMNENELFHLIEYAESIKIPNISLLTNGILLMPEIIEILLIHNVYIRILFYSYRESFHDSITGVKGSHSKTLKAIKRLIQRKSSFGVEIIVTRQNQDVLSETVKFLKELGVVDVHYQILKTERIGIFAEQMKSRVYRTSAQFPKILKDKFFRNKESNPCLNSKIAIDFNGDMCPFGRCA